MAKAPTNRAANKTVAAKKAATEAQFAEADAKGAPTEDELAAIAARRGVVAH